MGKSDNERNGDPAAVRQESAAHDADYSRNASGPEADRIAMVERIIFSESDIPEIPFDELSDELSADLPDADREFVRLALPELRGRLSATRYAHSVSVSRTSRRLARTYDVSLSMSARAGLLHDWDKCFKGQAVFDRVLEMGLELPENYELLRPIFHAVTGAKALAIRFPQLEPQVLQAVSRHTSGAVDMQPLDMVVYVSDMIEPLRTNASLVALRDMVGEVSLPDLFSACCEATVKNLVEAERSLHPDTARVWNAWVVPYESRRHGQS